MSRFENRLKSLEKSFPVPSLDSFLEALKEGELKAIILAIHKLQLAIAKDTGDKALAADLALIVKHDSAKLRCLPKQDQPSPKKTKQLLAALMEAKDDSAEFWQRDEIEDDFRQRVKELAAEIRFDQEFADLFEQLEAENIVEHLDENSMPIAGARMLPERNSTHRWRAVEFISPYIAARKLYVDPTRCRGDAEAWLLWRQYCQEANKKRKDILAGKSVPPPAAVPASAPSVKPKPSAIAAPARPVIKPTIKPD
jgi:hypothetical protein